MKMLLKVAKKTVPRLEWKRTPVILRATAGLRLLAPEKARALLEQVVHEPNPWNWAAAAAASRSVSGENQRRGERRRSVERGERERGERRGERGGGESA